MERACQLEGVNSNSNRLAHNAHGDERCGQVDHDDDEWMHHRRRRRRQDKIQKNEGEGGAEG